MPSRGGSGQQFIAPLETAGAAQSVFIGGSGELSLTAAGNFRFTIANPAASTKGIRIIRFDAFSSVAVFANLLVSTPLAAFTNPPTVTKLSNNTVFGSPVVANGVISADTNLTTALGGGFNTGIAFGVAANILTSYSMDGIENLFLAPGFAFGVNIPATVAANASLNVIWAEE